MQHTILLLLLLLCRESKKYASKFLSQLHQSDQFPKKFNCHAPENLQQSDYYNSHHTLNVSLLYLVKYLKS